MRHVISHRSARAGLSLLSQQFCTQKSCDNQLYIEKLKNDILQPYFVAKFLPEVQGDSKKYPSFSSRRNLHHQLLWTVMVILSCFLVSITEVVHSPITTTGRSLMERPRFFHS